MSSFKFEVGKPKKVTLAFDSPKEGDNQYGRWYLYGIKTDINDDEDSFFATYTLHTMIQTLGAKEGDDITIEKCDDAEMPYFKVNGLSITDMNNNGAIEKLQAAKPNPLKESLEVASVNEDDLKISVDKALADFKKLQEEFYKLEGILQEIDAKLAESVKDEEKYNVNDIPF
mgnify:FL=1|tara:strand:- start:352 stop:867 length:516 start_codon:yes stop_codon:yes gene_type:complete